MNAEEQKSWNKWVDYVRERDKDILPKLEAQGDLVVSIACIKCVDKFGIEDSIFFLAKPKPYKVDGVFKCPRCGSGGVSVEIMPKEFA